MLRVSMSGRAFRALIVTAVAVALLLPAAPPAHAASRVSTIKGGAWVKVDGSRYRVRLSVMKFGAEELINLSLGRSSDPDGDGTLRSKHANAWSFASVSKSVTVARDARGATLRTGSKLAPHVELDYTLTPTAKSEVTCGGSHKTTPGVLQGTLSLGAAGGMDAVEVRDMKATLETTEFPGCKSSSPSQWMFCPRSAEGLLGVGRSGIMITASWRPRGSKAVLAAINSRMLQLEDDDMLGVFGRIVVATVPASNVRLREDLRHGVMRGEAGTFIRGRAEFTGSGSTETETLQCDDSHEVTLSMRGGRLTGTMRVNHLAGRDFDLEGRRLHGFAARQTTRRI